MAAADLRSQLTLNAATGDLVRWKLSPATTVAGCALVGPFTHTGEVSGCLGNHRSHRYRWCYLAGPDRSDSRVAAAGAWKGRAAARDEAEELSAVRS
jgi:hypothetical protein